MLSLWDDWGDERGCDEGDWHAYTRGLRWCLPEVVGMVQRVHCSRRRLLRRGLEFHVCTINKGSHTKKSLKTYLMYLVNEIKDHKCKSSQNHVMGSWNYACLKMDLRTRQRNPFSLKRDSVVSPPLLRSVNGAVNNTSTGNLGPYFHLGQGMLSQNPSPLTLLSFLLSPFLSRSRSRSAQSAEIVAVAGNDPRAGEEEASCWRDLQILNTRVDPRTFFSQHVALYTKNKIPLFKLIFVLLIYYLKYHNSSTYITTLLIKRTFFHPTASKVARLFAKSLGLHMWVMSVTSKLTHRNKYHTDL